jgi:hypothetical protein
MAKLAPRCIAESGNDAPLCNLRLIMEAQSRYTNVRLDALNWNCRITHTSRVSSDEWFVACGPLVASNKHRGRRAVSRLLVSARRPTRTQPEAYHGMQTARGMWTWHFEVDGGSRGTGALTAETGREALVWAVAWALERCGGVIRRTLNDVTPEAGGARALAECACADRLRVRVWREDGSGQVEEAEQTVNLAELEGCCPLHELARNL